MMIYYKVLRKTDNGLYSAVISTDCNKLVLSGDRRVVYTKQYTVGIPTVDECFLCVFSNLSDAKDFIEIEKNWYKYFTNYSINYSIYKCYIGDIVIPTSKQCDRSYWPSGTVFTNSVTIIEEVGDVE